MIKAGMKNGDKFTDGGIQYVVDEVLPDGNYISKRADLVVEEPQEETEEVSEPEPQEAPKEEVKAVAKTGNTKKK